ncbi:MAG: PKD domain-containing protein, partial [bacterium]|nr:PKD domain-containing protein [bacterium]
FSAAPTSGDGPLPVTFTDQSTSWISSWSWDFGDGGTSTAQNPNRTYTVSGAYTVTLTVTGPGGSDGETKTNYINVNAAPPVARFAAAPLNGTAPLAVNFSDQSTGEIASFSWDFGDGATSTAQNPSHTYTTSGLYTVALTVTGPGGSGTETKTGYVDVNAAAPVAEFVGSPTSGTAPLAVSFSDQSTGEVTGFSWEFGDGATSSAQNPSHTYTTNGLYTVALTVTGPGGSGTETKTGYINVNAGAPVAEFAANPTSGTAPLAVGFSDQSTGEINTFAWDFGDGATSTAQNPTHTYTTSGLYTVALTVTGPGGNGTETKIDYIDVAAAAPVAEFSANPISGTAPLAVSFSDQSSGEITSFNWDFGDGVTSTIENPNHIYPLSGSYTVSLTVTGPGGSATETKTGYISVNAAAPTAEFTANPTSGTAPLAVTFSDQSTGEITGVAWDFGDGATSTAQNPSHTYATSGLYTVALTVTGPGGSATETKTRYIAVGAAAPVAAFVGGPTSGTAPLAVSFGDQSTGEIANWFWDFGDGTGSTVQSPSHLYTTSGVYTVALTVTGSGGSDTETKTGYITVNAAAPVAEFVGSPTSGTAPLAVSFNDLSTGEIASWSWSFGDGATSTQQDPSHTYTADGLYTVVLTVTGPGGSASETKTNYITVDAAAPVAEFVGSPASGTAPLAVGFSDQSTGVITSRSWSFGDGATSTAQSPNHTYAQSGTYTVALTVTGPGGSGTETKTDYIAVNAAVPVAEFSGSPTSGTAPLAVSFLDASTGEIASWSWDFGDGGTATAQNPNHTYTQSGTYTVALTVTGPGGSGTETKTSYVAVDAAVPVAEFSGSPTSGTAPLAVGFLDASTGEIASWSWDFGDGGTSTAQSPNQTYTQSGTYTVALTVTGPGGTDTETKTSYVAVDAAVPVAEFSGSPTSGTAPLAVSFLDASTGEIASWSWDFGDGGTSTAQNPNRTYTQNGTYTVALTVTGPGGTSTETKTDYVAVGSGVPSAEFSANSTSGPAPLAVDFSDLSTGVITSWAWTFGDGGTSTQANPSYTYVADGTYTVSLTVAGPGGADTETKVNYITISTDAPVADFAAAPTNGVVPLTSFFTDASRGTITTWFWTFGDGGSSIEQNPFHDFLFLGPHTVTLTVAGPGGIDSETKVGYIVVDPAVLGTNYCTATANSTGLPASIAATGSPYVFVNDVTLTATGLPPNEFGFFLSSPTQAFIPSPGNSSGNFCLGVGSNLGRFNGFVQNSGATGEFSLAIDLDEIPISVPPFVIALQAGDTWNFQAWFRDGQTSNFTDGTEVVFQ